MNNPPQIINLAKIVDKHLNGKQLISYSSRYLTKPGDNYGSIMLSISAKVQNLDGTIENLPLVAKLPPLTSKELWNLFQPEVTALRENAIYCDISPRVRQLQLDSGIPVNELVELFAKFYGCRISLDEYSTTLDRDAVLVLEDLQCSGYKAGKRNKMFDWDHIRIVLKYTAKYHAYSIALRNKDPKKFEEEILTKLLPHSVEETAYETLQMCKEVKLALGDDLDVINRYEQLDSLFHDLYTNKAAKKENNNNLFTTIAHLDLWINNIMIFYDETGTPDKLKIVDFQTCQYASLAHDLIFLLFTSVKTDILEEHFEDLLEYYYNEFINCLQAMLCDINEYSYEKFLHEVKTIAPVQIPHSIFMSKVIMTEDSNLSDEVDIKALQGPPSPALLIKIRDIIRLSQKFGFFW